MANEELFKRLGQVARKEMGSEPPSAPPVESAPQPETPPTESKPKISEFLQASKEQLAEFAKKISEGIPDAAKRIVGAEGEQPQDARVFAIVEGLLTADEAQLSDPTFLRGVGEKLVGVVAESGYTSASGMEARRYLNRIVAEHPSLTDLKTRSESLMPPISGGSGLPEEEPQEAVEPGEERPLTPQEEMRQEVAGLYDKSGADPLNDTPLARELQALQFRLEVDPDAIYRDPKLVDDTIKRIVEHGQKDGVDPNKVREATARVRDFEDYADIQYQKRREKAQGARAVRWGEIKGHAPKADIHEDAEVFPEFRYISPAEVEHIIRGTEGEAEWYFNLIDQIYSLGREETRPTLTHDQMFHEFKQYLLWKYGDEYPLVVQEYQKHWDSRGQFEYAVKGLMYNPGDVKDRLKAMSLLTGADLDYLYKNFDHSNEAYNLYEHVMFETMAEKRRVYGESLKYLDEEINWDGKHMKRKKILEEMKKKQKQEGFDPASGEMKKSPLSVDDQKLMHEIQTKMDLAAEGVMLWDSDVQSFTELHITLTKLQGRREELMKKKAAGTALTQTEMDQLDEVDRLYTIYSQRENRLNENFTKELLQTRGLSPVDIEVRKRLVEYLKTQNGGKEPPEYQVRMALWASRTAMIGSGRMAMIGAMMSIPPGEEYGTASGKHVMRAPAFEDLQRIFNPETFATRFSIGGDMGKTARSILRQNLLKSKGISEKDPFWFKKIGGAIEKTKEKLTHSKGWHEAEHHEHDKQRAAAMESMDFVENMTGISFNELLGPGFMASGGFYDGTAWRLEKGVADSLREKMLAMKKMPENAQLLDNQALSIQLLTAGNAAERRPILDRMLRRNPSKFLELLQEDTDKILAKNGVNLEEWRKFKEALSLAELKMAHDKEWQFARIDLADKKDFDSLLVPFLRTLGLDEGRMESMRHVLADMQEEVYRSKKIDMAGGTYRSKMDAIANLRLPLTMSLTDFDWKESNFYQLGTVAMHRRIRDVGAQMRARDGILELISNQEMLLSPNDYTKSLEKIKEIREAIIDYSGPEAAENTAREMARVLIEMNRHRALWSIGAVPGLTTLLKYAAEADLRGLEQNFVGKAINWTVKKVNPSFSLSHLPHSIAEAISYSYKFTGAHGNAWDEAKIEEVLLTMHDMGMFINHPEYIQDLRKEFGTDLGSRWFAMIRKYWWIVPLATIAIAAEQGVEEQKHGGGGGGH
jgi:hypothetical protein